MPGVDLAQNVFNGHSGTNHVRRVVHRKNDAGHDLNVQTDAAKATESPKDVQVNRGWIVVKVGLAYANARIDKSHRFDTERKPFRDQPHDSPQISQVSALST